MKVLTYLQSRGIRVYSNHRQNCLFCELVPSYDERFVWMDDISSVPRTVFFRFQIFLQSLLINSSINTRNCCLRFHESIHRVIINGFVKPYTAITSIDGRVYQQTLQIIPCFQSCYCSACCACTTESPKIRI